MCVICVEHFGNWLQNPSQLDVTRLGRPGWQWHEKRSSILICKTSGIFQLEILQIQWLETDVLRLRCHLNRKIGKECELANFNTKSFGWKGLALSDVGTGPQQNLKKRQKKVSTLDVSYSLGQLQPILQFRSFAVAVDAKWHVASTATAWLRNQHVDPAGRGWSSEIGSLPCTSLCTMNFETLSKCIQSTWKNTAS